MLTIIGEKMIRRFKTSLFAPQEIINMRIDNFGLVFLYLLILSIFLMLPACIKTARFESVSFDKRTQIMSAFKDEEIPFYIVNNELTRSSDALLQDFYIDKEIMVSLCLGELSDPEQNTSYRIVFSENGVDLYYYLLNKKVSSIRLFKYEEYDELTNINLKHANSEKNYDFWNDIFNVVNKEIKKYIPYVVIGVIIGYTFTNLCILLLVAIALALVQRIMTRRIISFKENYVIACYCLTPMVIAGLLSELFGVRFIHTIGVVVAVVYNMIASNQLLSIKNR